MYTAILYTVMNEYDCLHFRYVCSWHGLNVCALTITQLLKPLDTLINIFLGPTELIWDVLTGF